MIGGVIRNAPAEPSIAAVSSACVPGRSGRDHHFGTPLRQRLRGLAVAAPSQRPHPEAPAVEQGGDAAALLARGADNSDRGLSLLAGHYFPKLFSRSSQPLRRGRLRTSSEGERSGHAADGLGKLRPRWPAKPTRTYGSGAPSKEKRSPPSKITSCAAGHPTPPIDIDVGSDPQPERGSSDGRRDGHCPPSSRARSAAIASRRAR